MEIILKEAAITWSEQ